MVVSQKRSRSAWAIQASRRLFLATPVLLVACKTPRETDAEIARHDMFLDFCVPAPSETKVEAGVAAKRVFRVEVPDTPPDLGLVYMAPSQSISKNDVVSVTIHSETYGAAGIHGVTAIEKVSSGQPIHLMFRAIYQGRFGVHFHGADGSHFEVLGLQVL